MRAHELNRILFLTGWPWVIKRRCFLPNCAQVKSYIQICSFRERSSRRVQGRYDIQRNWSFMRPVAIYKNAHADYTLSCPVARQWRALPFSSVSVHHRGGQRANNVSDSNSKCVRNNTPKRQVKTGYENVRTEKRFPSWFFYCTVYSMKQCIGWYFCFKLSIMFKLRKYKYKDGLCGRLVRVPGYRSTGPGFDFRPYQIFWEGECGPLSLVRTTEKLLEWKVAAQV
jgi:hypothetical protein